MEIDFRQGFQSKSKWQTLRTVAPLVDIACKHRVWLFSVHRDDLGVSIKKV